ncbi:MAG: DNA repair protein RecN [Acidobacteria bacterium]|nr:DNA repair protein RecN [Acidobacteriota bacterium]
MLHELDIENYAVVAKLRVGFQGGLNLLTGETGSGKSILVDALSLLFGARADADSVRAGAEKARISGVFEAPSSPGLRAALDEAGIELEQGELILERHVLSGGKSRAYVNGRPATIALLRELAEHLGDIHGQHEQQNLFSGKHQMEMLDGFASVAELLAEAAKHYRDWRACERELAELRGNEQERLRLLDLYRFQHKEISGAALQPDEDATLEQERHRLRNVARLQESAAKASEALSEGASSAAAQLKIAVRAMEELARFEPELEPWPAQLESARAAVEDAGFELQRYLDGLEADPDRLDKVEERLANIEKLKRKYGKTLAEVLAYGGEVAKKVSELDNAEESAAKVEKRRAEAAKRYLAAAETLSAKRKAAAKKLQKGVEKELAALAMERARFEVVVEGGPAEADWTADGFDHARFDFSANPGQPPRPLAQVASGGELSRVALSLKTCLLAEAGKTAKRDKAQRTLVFDEIDTGVGGRVAEAIGQRLQSLAAGSQVLCVTHLPQIAGFAHAHYTVAKVEKGGQTFATLTELGADERVEELARMLSGAKVTPAALENAKQLLKTAGR